MPSTRSHAVNGNPPACGSSPRPSRTTTAGPVRTPSAVRSPAPNSPARYSCTARCSATLYPSTGLMTSRNVYFGLMPVWNVQYYNSGAQSSAQAIAQDRLGSVLAFGSQTTSYYPYGEEYTTTSQDREKFPRNVRDNFSGFDYARNPYYSSTLGRFLTGDPSLPNLAPADPTLLNRYTHTR